MFPCELGYEIWSQKTRVPGLYLAVKTAWPYGRLFWRITSALRTGRHSSYLCRTYMHGRCTTKMNASTRGGFNTHTFWGGTFS